MSKTVSFRDVKTPTKAPPKSLATKPAAPAGPPSAEAKTAAEMNIPRSPKSLSKSKVQQTRAPSHTATDQLSADLFELGVDFVDESDADTDDDEDEDKFDLSDTDSEGDDDVAWTLRRVKSMTHKKLGPWEARRHNSTGQLFFVQKSQSGGPDKCTWQAPAGFGEWEEYSDKETGQPYYFCKSTGETQWQPPAGLGATRGLLNARSLGAIFTQSFHSLPLEQKNAAVRHMCVLSYHLVVSSMIT